MSTEAASIFNTSKSINGCTFTIEWLLKSLRENEKVFQQNHGKKTIKNITSHDISDGKGVASKILKCTIFFEDSSETYSTILKVPGLEVFQEIQSKFSDGANMLDDSLIQMFISNHQKECRFYNEIAPLIGGPLPKVYKTEDWIIDEKEGCIHMEDLSQKGKTLTYFKTVNLNQVKNFVRNLAKMHKNILASDSKIWKGKFVESDHFHTFYFDIMETQIESFLGQCERREEFQPLTEKYQKIRSNKAFLLYAVTQAHLDLTMPSVIVHGDMHCGNLLWKIDSNSKMQDELAAIIDWQIMHEGSPMADLARFLTHTSDGKTRRESEGFVCELYHECLLAEFGDDATKVPYSATQLKRAYNFSFILQAFFTIQLVPIFFAGIKDKIADEKERKAVFEFGIQKALDAYQDIDRLFEGEMNDVFVKFGL